MISVGEDTKLYGWLKDLTVYSSNFAELKDSKNSGTKIKYRVMKKKIFHFFFKSLFFLFEDFTTS
jgi:hypothetical protein